MAVSIDDVTDVCVDVRSVAPLLLKACLIAILINKWSQCWSAIDYAQTTRPDASRETLDCWFVQYCRDNQVWSGKQYCLDFVKVESSDGPLMSEDLLARELTKKVQDAVEDTLNKVGNLKITARKHQCFLAAYT